MYSIARDTNFLMITENTNLIRDTSIVKLKCFIKYEPLEIVSDTNISNDRYKYCKSTI